MAVVKNHTSKWLSLPLIVLTIFVTGLVFLILLGALLPAIPMLGAIGTAVISFFTLHMVVAALLATLLSYVSMRVTPYRAAKVCLILGVVSFISAWIPVIAFVNAASDYDADISWSTHWSAFAPEDMLGPDETHVYAAPEGIELSVDVYLPADSDVGEVSIPVVMMHGGGWTLGERSYGRNWDRWMTQRGYTVFDIDYRLNVPTWDKAAPDVVCAMTWIAERAQKYNIDPNRFVVAGQSAGASLALQVGYGWGEQPVPSSCGGVMPPVAAVFSIYPPEDLVLGWELNTTIGPMRIRDMFSDYLGGTYDEVPERYRMLSPSLHVRSGLPPTFLAYGKNDHLIEEIMHLQMIEKLQEANVPYRAVGVPYSDHIYDGLWGSLGFQITRQVAAEFLQELVPLECKNEDCPDPEWLMAHAGTK